MSAVYRALLAEGDRYLEEAQAAENSPAATMASAALATAFYTRAALEKPDIVAAILAAAKARSNTAASPIDDPLAAAIDRHPAGKKRAPRRSPGTSK